MLDKDKVLQAQTTKLTAETTAAQQADREAKRQEAARAGRKTLIDSGGAVIDQINQTVGDAKSYQDLVNAAWAKDAAAVKKASKQALKDLDDAKAAQQTADADVKEAGRQREQVEAKADCAKKDFDAALKELQEIPQLVKDAQGKITELEGKLTGLINSGDDEATDVKNKIQGWRDKIDELIGGAQSKWDQVVAVWEKIPRADVEKAKEEEQQKKDAAAGLAAERQDREKNPAKYVYRALHPVGDCQQKAR